MVQELEAWQVSSSTRHCTASPVKNGKIERKKKRKKKRKKERRKKDKTKKEIKKRKKKKQKKKEERKKKEEEDKKERKIKEIVIVVTWCLTPTHCGYIRGEEKINKQKQLS